MGIKKITEKETASSVKDAAYLLLTQQEGTGAEATEVLRRVLLSKVAEKIAYFLDQNETYLTMEELETMKETMVKKVEQSDGKIIITYWDDTQDSIEVQTEAGLAFDSVSYDQETGYLHIQFEGEDVVSPCYIGGGGGSSTGGTSVKIENQTGTTASFAVSMGSPAKIKFSAYDYDTSGELTNSSLVLEMFVNNVVVKTQSIEQGIHEVDWNGFLSEGSNKCKIRVTDEDGIYATKSYTIMALNVSVTAVLSESNIYHTGEAIRIQYTPVGQNLSKTTHFLVDDVEVAAPVTSYSGRVLSQSITINSHGAHDIDIYCTAEAGDTEVESETVHFCIVVVGAEDTPIIAVHDKTPSGRVYSTTQIPYMVYDPSTENATVKRTVNGEVTMATVGRTMQSIAFKPAATGDFTIVLECGSADPVTITFTATALGYDINPVTEGLVFDFDPAGRSNTDANRDTWQSNGISLEAQTGFDWTNGGFRSDADGNTVFVVKAGSRAIIRKNIFPDIAERNLKTDGINFKMIVAAMNVRSFDADVASCMSGNVGFTINAREVTFAAKNTSISQYICEGERVEVELNATGTGNNSEMFINLNGVPSKFAVYDEGSSLNQTSPVNITIGSDDCDVWLYRCKAYDHALTDADQMDNYVADAPNADEMIARFEANTVPVGASRTRMYIDWNSGGIDEEIINSFAEEHPGLRIIKMRVPRFTTDKSDKVKNCTLEHQLYGARRMDRWINTNVTHKGQGTSSNAYGKSARNIDVDCKGTFDYEDEDGETVSMDTYAMTENSMGEAYFNIKLNVASSENCNNAMMARLFNQYQPYLRDMRRDNPKVRDTMEFFPCVVFVCNESAEEGFVQNEWTFYGVGDFGNSKKNNAAQGLDETVHPNEVIVELCNNTHPFNRFKSSDGITTDASWETDDNPNAPLSFRYIAESCNEAAARAAWHDVVAWVQSTDRENATDEDLETPVTYGGVEYTADTAEYRAAKFVAEFDDHFEPHSTLYHYLVTLHFIMADNRAKNTFPHCDDITAAKPKWDFVFGYDFDTSMGINNEGDLALDYGMEDIDTIDGRDVFNAQDSVLWANIRDLMGARLTTELNGLAEFFNLANLNRAFDDYQNTRPVALRVADARRKYIRPYEELTEVDANGNTTKITMFIPMMNGDKQPQRHYFLKYQVPYFASKFNTAVARNDKITLRGFANPSGELAAITITPYADLYVSVLFGSDFEQQRCSRGESVTLQMQDSTGAGIALNDTEVYIYSASLLEGLEGLPSVMTNQADFSAAAKLKVIKLGDDDEEYSNPNLVSTTKWDLSSLTNLEEFYIDNCPNFTASIDFSGCSAMRVFSAKGTPVSSVIFAPGGALETCYLHSPSSITLRDMKNIETFVVEDGYEALTGLRHENTPYPAALDILEAADNLTAARIVGIDWTLQSTAILNKLAAIHGYDGAGNETVKSVLIGEVYVETIRSSEQDTYAATWTDCEITYGEVLVQYPVSFYDYDETPLVDGNGNAVVIYVDQGDDCPDPIGTYFATPSREPTVSTSYAFAGWDKSLDRVLGQRKIYATYTETTRQYTVRWLDHMGAVKDSQTLDYGSTAVYAGDPLERTDGEENFTYYIFKGWDKSTAFVSGNIDVNPVWTRGTLPEIGADTTALNAAQVLAVIEQLTASDFFTAKDRVGVTMGFNPDYSNIRHETVAEDLELDGATVVDTGKKIMEEDSDWCFEIDLRFESETAGQVAASCFEDDGLMGFNVKYDGGPAAQWGSGSFKTSQKKTREIMVIRHVKGDKNVTVYSSMHHNNACSVTTFTKVIDTQTNQTLKLGGAVDYLGQESNYMTGTIFLARIWWGDLGDADCRKIVSWPRETLLFEVGNFGAYKLSENTDERTDVDFICASELERTHVMNSSNTNAGGYEASAMHTYVNGRVYDGMPEDWKYIIRQCRVNYIINVNNDGHGDVSTCDAKVWIPALAEVSADYRTSEPYCYEGTLVPFFTNNASRVKFQGKPLREGYSVWSQNTDPALNSANTVVDGDLWIDTGHSSTGMIRYRGAWVSATYFWLRGAYLSNATNFDAVYNYGNTYTGTIPNASYSYGVVPRFSISRRSRVTS